MLFLGNRETTNNEFVVNFGIDAVDEKDRDSDVMIPIKNINNG